MFILSSCFAEETLHGVTDFFNWEDVYLCHQGRAVYVMASVPLEWCVMGLLSEENGFCSSYIV